MTMIGFSCELIYNLFWMFYRVIGNSACWFFSVLNSNMILLLRRFNIIYNTKSDPHLETDKPTHLTFWQRVFTFSNDRNFMMATRANYCFLHMYTHKIYKFCWEWVSDCCLTPTQQFFSYVMARTSYFSMRCTRPTHLVGFVLCQLTKTTVRW